MQTRELTYRQIRHQLEQLTRGVITPTVFERYWQSVVRELENDNSKFELVRKQIFAEEEKIQKNL